MSPAPLPGGIGQHFGNSVLDTVMGITGDKEDTTKPACFEVLEEALPRRVGFRGGNMHAEHFVLPVGVDPGSKQHCAFDHPAAFTHF